jgi:Ca-activated chloride channel family protein
MVGGILMSRFPKSILLSLAALLLHATAAHAQGFILPPRPVPGPRPIPAPGQPAVVRSQKINLRVTGGAMRVEVEQVFYNPNGRPLEGTYLFPLPEGATVSNFRMTIGAEPVDGKLLTAQEARQVYESYVRRNIDPAILEYVGRNAFQARIFPIPAGGERRISLGYSQTLEFQNGIYHGVYPLNSERVTGQSLGNLTIDCDIRSEQPIRTVYSPTHEVQVRIADPKHAHATFEGRDVRANRDFLFYYTVSDKAFGLNALTHRKPGDDGYLMLMLAPRREVAASEVQPKDVVVVFDTSGSMQGEKIEQARKALLTIVGALNDRDRFNIVRFSSESTNFKESVVPASAENRSAARAFVNEFKAVGGTAIDDGLQAGLATLPPAAERKGRTPFLIFMTDGLPTIGMTDPNVILQNSRKAAPEDLRLFTFGVGDDVNTLLLDRLARDHHGDADYVARDEDLEVKIGSFYAKVAEPVLSDVQVAVSGAKVSGVYPHPLPDLFAGSQLLLFGRYQGQGAGTVTLTGTLNGKPQRYTYPVTLPEQEMGQEFIPKLWAGRRIGHLLEEIRLHGENAELKDEVIRLSKEHGIVTPYTSYLVEEPGAVPAQLQLGARWRDNALFGEGARAGGLPGGPQAGLMAGRGGGFGGGGVAAKRSAGKPGAAGAAGAAGPPGVTPEGLDFYDRGYQLRAKQEAAGFKAALGQDAVAASRRLRELKDRAGADERDVDLSRTVAGRGFRFEKGLWSEQSPRPPAATVTVKYGSDAYFQLVAARAEWAKILSLGRRVSFRTGKTTAVTIAETGKEKLTPEEIKALEK